MRQRYISKELTHFVGASLRGEPDRQYDLLSSILRSGKLKSKHYQKEGGLLYFTRVEANHLGEAVETPSVCFCDIPVEDFEIHSNKYSKFGLAFTKEFLLPQGANPVFYVAKQSTTLPVRADFTLRDVVRALIPESYAQRFHSDFPDYYNQLSFIE